MRYYIHHHTHCYRRRLSTLPCARLHLLHSVSTTPPALVGEFPKEKRAIVVTITVSNSPQVRPFHNGGYFK